MPSKTEVTHQSITEDQEAELERMEEEMQLWRQNREKELERWELAGIEADSQDTPAQGGTAW